MSAFFRLHPRAVYSPPGRKKRPRHCRPEALAAVKVPAAGRDQSGRAGGMTSKHDNMETDAFPEPIMIVINAASFPHVSPQTTARAVLFPSNRTAGRRAEICRFLAVTSVYRFFHDKSSRIVRNFYRKTQSFFPEIFHSLLPLIPVRNTLFFPQRGSPLRIFKIDPGRASVVLRPIRKRNPYFFRMYPASRIPWAIASRCSICAPS